MKIRAPRLDVSGVSLVWALIFGLWQPFVLWRGIAAAVFLIIAVWGFVSWYRRRPTRSR
ncbi:hypothetical protein [Arthrobacter sp. NA-172]|uniref:hypothetical protein n=1 Tax=Arthrobacter sp. NA-172 TaxID=3367524 RepID=UPI00375446B7